MRAAGFTTDGSTRFSALCLSAALHVAAGFALFLTSSFGVPERQKPTSDRGEPLVVELIPLDRMGLSSDYGESKAAGERRNDQRGQRGKSDGVVPTALEERPAGSTGKAELRDSSTSPAGSDAPSIPPTEMLAFRAQLQEHLARYRIYPAAAHKAGKEGIVQVRFLMSHDGNLIDAWIESSSGNADIDGEALASLKRARPLPTPPRGWPDRIDISLPITFRIG